MRALARVLFLAVILLALAGCNVVAMKQAGIERGLRDAGLRPATVQLGPDTIHYWDGGSGPPLLLLHGFGGTAIWLWHPQAEDLARDHRVIVPDLLFWGGSDSTDRDLGLDHQVRAMEALLDKLGVREVDVAGVSYGGLVAHELASERAEAVRRLMIVDSPGRVYTRADYDLLCRKLHVDHLGKVLIPADDDGVELLLGLAYYDPPWVPGFALRQSRALLYADRAAERRGMLDALLRDMDRMKARPATLRARTMVVWGREDPVFPVEIGERLARSLNADLRILPRARHAPNMEHAAEFNRILRGFLAR
jgi:pimeloyl-ACP methyl ester carboxylesterase